ncbi:unnamed protein product [Protopolystoma xenopodis]|uniref:Uncharacterized protein n=1 Tax=Protopolystoma xenopodis TaxID=117903 RepID=A0A448WCD0_9PLAT|nr:unnamed protein product [Protopolystoma xenopodis]
MPHNYSLGSVSEADEHMYPASATALSGRMMVAPLASSTQSLNLLTNGCYGGSPVRTDSARCDLAKNLVPNKHTKYNPLK